MRKAGLVGVTPIGPHPLHVVADDMTALLDTPVIGICRDVGRMHQGGQRIGKKAGDVVVGRRAVGFQRKQVIPAPPHDDIRDGGLRAHGIDGDQGIPANSNRSSSSGMAVISLDLASVASWPRTRR